MQVSFLIVTKNRTNDLVVTLNKLKNIIDPSKHEVLVLIDGCAKTEQIINLFNWVSFTVLKESISASPARNLLYKKAKGGIFIGLDDDAHPISDNFISSVETEFAKNENLGIIAFQEVRGVFESDSDALKLSKPNQSYLTNDFIGCGFAIKKKAYQNTNGFPLWIDIYGEESALALEVLNLGLDIKYISKIIVNHRIDPIARKLQGRNYFRFEKQLKNAIKYYLVYYKNPTLKIAKLLFHNFKKYALRDIKYFKLFFKVIFSILTKISIIIKYRKPVNISTIRKAAKLKQLTY